MNRVLCILLIALTSLAYAGSFGGEWMMDDYDSILQNEDIHSLQFGAIRSTYGPTRPVSAFTVAANYWVGGAGLFGYHLVNLLIHLAATLTLFGLVRRLDFAGAEVSATSSAVDGNQAQTRIAFVAALLFALHPLQTSAVTYITQRMESLTSLFVLLMLWSLVRSARAARPWLWWCVSLSAFTLGVFSKEVAVTAPAVAVLLDRVFLSKTWRGIWQQRRWLYAAYVIPLMLMAWTLAPKLHFLQPDYGQVVTLGVDPDALDAREAAIPTGEGDPRSRAASQVEIPNIAAPPGVTLRQFARSQPTVILHYFRLTFWPTGQCFDYQWQPETSALKIAVTSGVIFLMLVVSAWWVLRPGIASAGHRIAFPILAVFILLSPRSTFQVLDLAVEYRMYLPLAAIAPLFAWSMHALAHRLRSTRAARLTFAVGSAVICVLIARQTIQRNELFTSRLAMWGDVVSGSPLNARAKLNYGTALAREGDWQAAMQQTQQAIDLFGQPHVQQFDPALAYLKLGDRWSEVGEEVKAREAYDIALRLSPGLKSSVDRAVSSLE